MAWSENLGLNFAPSATAGLFGEVLGLAGELGALDHLGLGNSTRPEEEGFALRSLESSLLDKGEALARRLTGHDLEVKAEIFTFIDEVRTGNVDFMAEAQAALDGCSTEITETTGYLTLYLIEFDHNGP